MSHKPNCGFLLITCLKLTAASNWPCIFAWGKRSPWALPMCSAIAFCSLRVTASLLEHLLAVRLGTGVSWCQLQEQMVRPTDSNRVEFKINWGTKQTNSSCFSVAWVLCWGQASRASSLHLKRQPVVVWVYEHNLLFILCLRCPGCIITRWHIANCWFLITPGTGKSSQRCVGLWE